MKNIKIPNKINIQTIIMIKILKIAPSIIRDNHNDLSTIIRAWTVFKKRDNLRFLNHFYDSTLLFNTSFIFISSRFLFYYFFSISFIALNSILFSFFTIFIYFRLSSSQLFIFFPLRFFLNFLNRLYILKGSIFSKVPFQGLPCPQKSYSKIYVLKRKSITSYINNSNSWKSIKQSSKLRNKRHSVKRWKSINCILYFCWNQMVTYR